MDNIDTERAAVRAQIVSDQAQRAAGETHTARTVEAAARQASALWARMSADQQRHIFGGVVFGRRELRHRNGRFEVRRSVGFGGDSDEQDWSYAEVATLLNRGETVVGKKD
jgi:hypothetical protein